jgi:hypothetical protein
MLIKQIKKTGVPKTPITCKQTTQHLLNQINANSEADDLLSFIKQALSAINKEKTYAYLLIQGIASHINIRKVTDVPIITSLLLEIGVVNKTENMTSNMQLLCGHCEPGTIVCAVIAAVPKIITESEELIEKAMEVIFRRLDDVSMERVLDELDRHMKEFKSSKVYDAYHKLVASCVKSYGLSMWESIKQETNEDLAMWVDDTVYTIYPDFCEIINSMKTKGVKGVAANLKIFTLAHKEFDFDRASNRCSLIFMKQIKEEMDTEKKEPIKSSIDKIKEKLHSKTPHNSSPSNVEARFKELSNEIVKMKHKGAL